ncbi:Hypothetical predicted protein [Octopus vulgaris]|uniref:Protein rolling stone-like n=1 Tax=Octopus vulgaris TaxID=6645 RepID=A0AA36AY98_OCTVU|nr:Hypothetical predicted protein [Octopus vulgaris]
MRNFFKSEFAAKNIWFGYPRPEVFYLPQWHRLSNVFVIYRVLTALFTIACLINYIIATTNDPDTDHNVMAYLTTWAYIILMLHFNIAAVVAVYWKCRSCRGDPEVSNYINVVARPRKHKKSDQKQQQQQQQQLQQQQEQQQQQQDQPTVTVQLNTNGAPDEDTEQPVFGTQLSMETAMCVGKVDQTTWYMKLSWMFYNVSFVSAIVVTLVFFGAVYPNLSPEDKKSSLGISFEDLSIHGLNTLLVLMEVALSSFPVRLVHALYPMLYGLLYMVFNISYWSYDPKRNVIYEGMLDWNHPLKCLILVVLLVFVVTPILQITHFLFYKLRSLVFGRSARLDSTSSFSTCDV